MKKITLVVQSKDSVRALEDLRHFGSVHVEHVRPPAGRPITELSARRKKLERVIAVLSQFPKPEEQVRPDDCQTKAWEVLGLVNLVEQYKDAHIKRQVQIDQWMEWGNFNPDDIELLASKGLSFRLVEVPEKDLNNVPDGVHMETIFTKNKVARCVAVSEGDVELPFPVIAPPAVSLEELQRAQAQDEIRLKEAEAQLKSDTRYLDCFRDILTRIDEDMTFQQTLAGLGDEGGLVYLKGYCPAEQCAKLETESRRRHWGLLIEDPGEDDQVPTLIRNPKWVTVVNPVYQMINIQPGYEEADISIVFLFFFTLFFGMLIGDAGYGLIFGAVTLVIHILMGRKVADKRPFYLMYLLSGVTILWGRLTGTFFGQEWLPAGRFQPLVPWLNNTSNLQVLCFLIGAIHLTIAHAWRALRKFPSLNFVADIGWACIIWVMFFVAQFLILETPLPAAAGVLFGTGLFLILFFTKPDKNLLKAFGSGLGDLALNIINSFTDVVSYIRLYAVGLATVAVADAANQMDLFWVIFLHTLNIVLGAMAILVHGLRLNVLEFSGHLDLGWSGFKFNPFRKVSKI